MISQCTLTNAQEPTWNLYPGLPYASSLSVMAVNGTDIYVGGLLSLFSDAHYLAKFNTLTGNFSKVANGTQGEVTALCVRGSELFVGAIDIFGYGTYIGKVDTVSNQWVPMGDGGPTRKRKKQILKQDFCFEALFVFGL